MSTVILKSDERVFDTNGRNIRYPSVAPEEPYDPEYLEKEIDHTVKIERSEIRMFRKIETLTKALKRAKVFYNWVEDEFRVERQVGKTTLVRCLWIQDDQFCYGTDETVILESEDVKEVVAKVAKWFNQ